MMIEIVKTDLNEQFICEDMKDITYMFSIE